MTGTIEELIEEADDLLLDDAAAAEAKAREAIALADEAPQAADRSQRRTLDRLLAEALLARRAFDEAFALWLGLKQTAVGPVERWDACHNLASLEWARERLPEATAFEREALGVAEAGGRRFWVNEVQSFERLLSFAEDARSEAEAARLAEDLRDARRRLLDEFYLPAIDTPMDQLRAGALPVSSDEIWSISHGRLTSGDDAGADGRPVPGGLRCWKIFGPERDFECACGRHRGLAERNVVCEECGVEVIPASSRQSRPAHLPLATTVLHPFWKKLVLKTLGDSIETFFAREAPAIEWRCTEATKELDLRAREGMLIDTLPIYPPEARLPFSRPAYEQALRGVIAATTALEVQRAVEALFAVTRSNRRTPEG